MVNATLNTPTATDTNGFSDKPGIDPMGDVMGTLKGYWAIASSMVPPSFLQSLKLSLTFLASQDTKALMVSAAISLLMPVAIFLIVHLAALLTVLSYAVTALLVGTVIAKQVSTVATTLRNDSINVRVNAVSTTDK